MVDRGDSGAPFAIGPGDPPDALRDFFDIALGEVYPYLLRRCGGDLATAEDLTQDTFVSAVRTLRDGRIDRLTVGWLITCAQSRFIDHCRSEDRRLRHLSLVTASESDPIDDGVLAEMLLDEHLGVLPPSQRLVVVLHHLDGLSVPDVAKRTDRSVRAVESLLARARRTMRQRTQEDPDGR